MTRHSALACLLLATLLVAPACQRDEVTLTAVPSGPAPSGPTAHESAPDPQLRQEAPDQGVEMPSSEMAERARGRVVYEAPSHWQETPPSSSMRVAQWALPGSTADAPAECIMFHFPGGGSVDDNIFRWLGQFEQDDGSPTTDRALRATREVNDIEVTLVKTQGLYRDQVPPMTGPVFERPAYALFGAVFTPPGDPYFLKCTGPQNVLESEEPAMVSLVDSFRVQGAP